MFCRCCCLNCIWDCFIISPARRRKNKVKRVKWNIVETQNYVIKIPVFHKEDYLKQEKKKKHRRP